MTTQEQDKEPRQENLGIALKKQLSLLIDSLISANDPSRPFIVTGGRKKKDWRGEIDERVIILSRPTEENGRKICVSTNGLFEINPTPNRDYRNDASIDSFDKALELFSQLKRANMATLRKTPLSVEDNGKKIPQLEIGCLGYTNSELGFKFKVILQHFDLTRMSPTSGMTEINEAIRRNKEETERIRGEIATIKDSTQKI